MTAANWEALNSPSACNGRTSWDVFRRNADSAVTGTHTVPGMSLTCIIRFVKEAKLRKAHPV